MDRGEAVELDSYGLAAYRCMPNVAALTADVQVGIRAGELPVPLVGADNVGMVVPREYPTRRDAA